MREPGVPVDEIGRIKAVERLGLLDTDPEERFDRVTRLASRVFDVPISLVTIVDTDRQWFKSCVGLDTPETPRAVSFCGHAILDDQPLVVPDASVDLRFWDNPLVLGEPKIRFYAGQPIRDPDGFAIGTLCIVDRRRRTFTEDDRRLLVDLAAVVERELVTISLGRAVTSLLDVADATLDGLSVLDAVWAPDGTATDFTFRYVNRRAEEILGAPAAKLIGRRASDVFTHSAPYLIGRWGEVVATRRPYEEEIELVGRDGAVRRLRQQVIPMSHSVAVTSQDITTRKVTDA
jgi:PAS domain S-box-containing protein